ARAGVTVHGIDVDASKVNGLAGGRSHVQDVSEEQLRPLIQKELLRPTADFSVLGGCDAAIICVPTPLRKTRDPDISYIVAAVEEIARFLHPGLLVVPESSTAPRTAAAAILPPRGAAGSPVG